MPKSAVGRRAAVRAVVVDTSVFVAAGFRPRSDSGRVIEALRVARLRLVWDEPTRRETERVLRKIPPIDWDAVADLFSERDRFGGDTDPAAFTHVPDEEDRKFAALANAAGVTLVTLDRPLLDAGRTGIGPPFVALRPGAFLDGS